MSAYANDDRVQLWPNGLWTVTATVGDEHIDYTVAEGEGGLFDAWIGERFLSSVSGQEFDDLVENLIGEPQ